MLSIIVMLLSVERIFASEKADRKQVVTEPRFAANRPDRKGSSSLERDVYNEHDGFEMDLSSSESDSDDLKFENFFLSDIEKEGSEGDDDASDAKSVDGLQGMQVLSSAQSGKWCKDESACDNDKEGERVSKMLRDFYTGKVESAQRKNYKDSEELEDLEHKES